MKTLKINNVEIEVEDGLKIEAVGDRFKVSKVETEPEEVDVFEEIVGLLKEIRNQLSNRLSVTDWQTQAQAQSSFGGNTQNSLWYSNPYTTSQVQYGLGSNLQSNSLSDYQWGNCAVGTQLGTQSGKL